MTEEATIQSIPVVPLRGGAVFPGVTTTISIGRQRSLAAAQAAMEADGQLLIVVQYKAEIENPEYNDLVSIGIRATIRDIIRTQRIGVQMLVELHERVHLVSLSQNEPYLKGIYKELEEQPDAQDEELINEILAYLNQYAEALGEANPQAILNARSRKTNGELSDYIAGILNIPFDSEVELLTTTDGRQRIEILLKYLVQELRITEIRNKIKQDSREGADKAQRDFLLREQMRAIRKELGQEGDDPLEDLRQKIEQADMPEEIEERALSELKRLDYQGPQSAEASVIRTYLEWLIDLPWNKETDDNFDIKHVREILDEDHYGLEDVKDRIVEYVAVRKLAGKKMRGAIINLNGPPGVGKTSIATSVARAVGRELVRLSLGGVRDEAEIRGHRRTYIGAIPGRIIRALRDAQTRNPVIVLDEIDKVGTDWRGDPSSALLEVLDPEQNHSFTDHYLEVPFDLSQVIFITTSNQLSTIPLPLLDRMETINMLGYIEDEKFAIAESYLLPKQLAAHGVEDVEVSIEPQALTKMIRHYTRESGVRQLERTIGKVIRKLAVQISGGETGPFVVSTDDIEEFLGPEKFSFGLAEEMDEIGVATGLAVNAFGGDILPIEVGLSEGTGKITLTGLLGDVMRESAQAALTYARSNARTLGLEPGIFDRINLHIHVPDGATPKDGPSAGIGMATAVISAITRRPVRRDVAMTGEVTLRGKVLPIGGLKSKTIAAHRAGITTVIIPADNLKEVPDLPQKIREDLNLIAVSNLDEVLKLALLDPAGPPVSLNKKPDNNEINVIIPPPMRRGVEQSIQAAGK